VSAHPKVDRKNGDLVTFGYNFDGLSGSYLKYSLFDKNKVLKNTLDIPIRGPIMIHDFSITKDYVVFNDLPL
jgi:carotenoid cleavage dioxygenase-like enzyme